HVAVEQQRAAAAAAREPPHHVRPAGVVAPGGGVAAVAADGLPIHLPHVQLGAQLAQALGDERLRRALLALDGGLCDEPAQPLAERSPVPPDPGDARILGPHPSDPPRRRGRYLTSSFRMRARLPPATSLNFSSEPAARRVISICMS